MRAQLQQLSHRWHAHCHYITNGWRNCSLGGRQTTIGGIYRAGDQEEDNSNPLFNWCTSSAAFPQGCAYRSAGIWSHMDLLCSSRALRLSFRSCSSNCKTRLFIGRFSQELEFTICDGELFNISKNKNSLSENCCDSLSWPMDTDLLYSWLHHHNSSNLSHHASKKHFISLQAT